MSDKVERKPIDFDDLVRRVDAGDSYATVARDYGVTRQYIAQCYRRATFGQSRLSIALMERSRRQIVQSRHEDVRAAGKAIPVGFMERTPVSVHDTVALMLLQGRSLKAVGTALGLTHQQVGRRWQSWIDSLADES